MFKKVIYSLLVLFAGLLVWVLYVNSGLEQESKPVNSVEIKQEVTQSKPTSMPDFRSIQDTQERKKAFVNFILPAIEEVNRQVLLERKFLLDLDLSKMTAKEEARFSSLAEKYKEDLSDKNVEQVYKNLLIKVDEIAPALALAQAANESAWGTSRFARKGLNFYGQWCFSEGCGLVPNQRTAGLKHEVRVFKSVKDSVEAYILNLNSFHTYDDLREIRAKLRKKNQPVTGVALAQGLLNYSERREEYIRELQQMIRFNKWDLAS